MNTMYLIVTNDKITLDNKLKEITKNNKEAEIVRKMRKQQ